MWRSAPAYVRGRAPDHHTEPPVTTNIPSVHPDLTKPVSPGLVPVRGSLLSVHVTTWNDDPWTLGPYSTLGVGGTPADRSSLQVPIDDCLVLAGEHTSADYPATMHGAFLSGIEAANQLLATRMGGSSVIVGAGLAGLAAAHRLRSQGWDVTVVEATDRLGGRARTDVMGAREDGAPINYHPGAAWFHGIEGNPIKDLADQLGVTAVHPWPGVVRAARDGQGAVSAATQQGTEKTADGILQLLREWADESRELDEDDRPMLGALEDLVNAIDTPEDRSAVQSQLDMHFESLMAANLRTLSFQRGDEDYAFPGGDAYVTGSLGVIAAHLARDLTIAFNEPVIEVARRQDGVSVMTTHRTILADTCITTLPLGVLQAERVRFVPPLPDHVSAAMSRLEVGHKCKVFVRFTQRWWGDAQALHLFPTAQWTGPTQWARWVDASLPSNVPMLCGFLGGHAAQRVQDAFARYGDHPALRREIEAALQWLYPV
jgi:monoamine oxidase